MRESGSDWAGFMLSYAGLIAFTLILYFRPNELPAFADFPIVRIVGVALLAVFLLEWLPKTQHSAAFPKEVKYVLGLLGLTLLSVPLAENSGEAMYGILDGFLKVVLVFVILVYSVNSYIRLRRIMSLTVVCGTVIAIGTLRNYLAGEHLVEGYRASGILGGMFENPNDLALALTLLIPLAVGLAFTSPAILKRSFYLSAASLMAYTVLVTYSRAGFLSLLAAGLYLFVTMGRRSAGLKFSVVSATLILILFAPSGFGARTASIFDFSLDPVASAQARYDLIWRGLAVAGFNPKRWAIGVGYMNFHIVSIQEGVNHNAYLQVFNEIGLPAFVLYILFLAGAFKGLKAALTSNPAEQSLTNLTTLAIAIRASLVAYFVGSFFASVAYLWYIYYSAGYAICLREIGLREKVPERTST